MYKKDPIFLVFQLVSFLNPFFLHFCHIYKVSDHGRSNLKTIHLIKLERQNPSDKTNARRLKELKEKRIKTLNGARHQ